MGAHNDMGADNGYQHPNSSADGIETASKWGRFHGRYQHDFRVLTASSSSSLTEVITHNGDECMVSALCRENESV